VLRNHVCADTEWERCLILEGFASIYLSDQSELGDSVMPEYWSIELAARVSGLFRRLDGILARSSQTLKDSAFGADGLLRKARAGGLCSR